ncbi:PREDICTED: uncharacterized protein LOC102011799 isoform X1 [Chinchilla lanigera]|uniref:uncharacterized protein LOC102011799 isoform X1 n=1 Tax=Chinchilla lanigera TaxID=34839 RepID=UPI00038F14FC|nr:PREDICTED: uncharacterized protein LOC102011799 isoform X1 [Chinchilla lanigera]
MDLLNQGGPACHLEQSHQKHHAEWCKQVQNLLLQLGLEHHSDGDEEEEMDSSVELREEEVDVLSESVAELSFLGSGPAFPPVLQEHHLNTAAPVDDPEASPVCHETKAEDTGRAQEQKASKVLGFAMELQAQMWTHLWTTFHKWRDTILFLRCSIRGLLSQKNPVRCKGQSHQLHEEWRMTATRLALHLCPAPCLAACPQGLPRGPFSHQQSEEPRGSCIPGKLCVGAQLGQRPEHGSDTAAVSLSPSAPRMVAAHSDAGKQWLLSPGRKEMSEAPGCVCIARTLCGEETGPLRSLRATPKHEVL